MRPYLGKEAETAILALMTALEQWMEIADPEDEREGDSEAMRLGRIALGEE